MRMGIQMSQIEKLRKKFYRKPIPNDITYPEMEKLARFYHCTVLKNGGKHSLQIVYKPLGRLIPIPVHGDTVKEAYIRELKALFDLIAEKEGLE